jgi:glycosyltransferase involved in cell wall biosynthesis
MHILYLHQHFALPSGAKGIRSYELARRWVLAGHQVTVICGNSELSGLPKSGSLQVEGINILVLRVRYDQKQKFSRRILAFLAFAAACTLKALSVPAVDVIFASSTPLTVGLPPLLLKRIKALPFVFEVRDQWPAVPIAMGYITNRLVQALLRSFERRIYLQSSGIIALSPGMAEGIRSAIGNASHPIAIAPNCADTDFFDRHPDRSGSRRQLGWENKVVVLHFGTMGLVNSLDFLLSVAQRIRFDLDILFVLIGEGSERNRLTRQVHQLDLPNIQIHGPLPRKELPAILAACDISTVITGAFPILQNNSANKFFESLAAGKPVLLNYSGWQRQVLESAQAGLGTRLCDIDAYVQNLTLLAGSAAKRLAMGANAKRLAMQNFHPQTIATRVLSVLERVAAGTP